VFETKSLLDNIKDIRTYEKTSKYSTHYGLIQLFRDDGWMTGIAAFLWQDLNVYRIKQERFRAHEHSSRMPEQACAGLFLVWTSEILPGVNHKARQIANSYEFVLKQYAI